MCFIFCDSMINHYLSQGYVIFRGIVPASLLNDLRVQADKARKMAHQLNGPQAQRIQPLGNYAEEIDLTPFENYNDLPELREACKSLLGPGYSHGHLDIMGLLVEPLHRPSHCGWHRDAIVEVPLARRDEILKKRLDDVWDNLHFFNQINCPLYADSCTWFVPGSHLRQKDLAGEQESCGKNLAYQVKSLSDVEAERFLYQHCNQFPGAVQLHLRPGDFLLYRNLAWHTGNYLPYQPRATIHDVMLHDSDRSWLEGWSQ